MNKRFIVTRFFSIATLIVLCLSSANLLRAQAEIKTDKSLAALYEEFKAAVKKSCGERSEALGLGKLIVEKHGADELNKDVIEFVKKRTAAVEKEEKRCRAGDDFGPRKREEIIPKGKLLLNELNDKSAALDVILDMVSAGYDDLVVYKNKTFVKDTFYYARLAIELIEAGQNSNSGKYGAIFPFETKENALSWLNYIAGWIMYHENGQRREALEYFYKATLFDGNEKNKIAIYNVLGKYYFDEAVRLDADYREKRKTLGGYDSEETKSIAQLAGNTAERSMEFFGRAYLSAVEQNLDKNLVNNLFRTLNNLYYFRIKGQPGYKMKKELDEYLELLKNRPVTNITKPVIPEDSLDEKLKRLP